MRSTNKYYNYDTDDILSDCGGSYDSLSLMSPAYDNRVTFRLDGRIRALFAAFLRRLRSYRSSSGQLRLLDLPNELLIGICEKLPLVSRVALFLTCKQLLDLGQSAVSSKQFRFPQVFYTGVGNSVSKRFNLRTERWELLCLLENKRWLCCSGCLMLHPTGQFSKSELKTKPRKRMCMLDGFVSICPCFSISFRQKVRLAHQLRESQPRECQLHQCSKQHGSWTIDTKVFVELNISGDLSEAGMFQVRTVYQVLLQDRNVSGHGPPRLVCPHMTLATFIRGMKAEFEKHTNNKRSNYLNYQTGVCCLHCSTLFRVVSVQIDDWAVFFNFTTVRSLGHGEVEPDHRWQRQTVYPRKSYSCLASDIGRQFPWNGNEVCLPDGSLL